MSLFDWGYSSAWTERFHPHRQAGLAAASSNSKRKRGAPAANSPLDLPVTGDWVAVTQTDPALIIAVVEPQPLAANIDVAFLVCGLDHDWNPRAMKKTPE